MTESGLFSNIENNILDTGISIIFVGHDDEAVQPAFSYSIGASLKGFPEALVVGFSPENCTAILNLYYRAATDDKIVVGGLNTGVFATPFYVLPLDRKSIDAFFRVATGFLTFDFEAVQLVFPDKAGRFPWDSKVGADWRDIHRVYAKPPMLN